MRVRWALEETGRPYNVRLVSFAAMKAPEHRALQPFGQIPTYEADSLVLFETGAIILHIAESHEGLLPTDPVARARACSWMFAAVSTLEPPIVEREAALLVERGQPWFEARLPLLDERIRKRLTDLSVYLGRKDWLDGPFSAADLMTIDVLRRPAGSALLGEFPNLAAYVARGEARPAFRRAFAAQLAVFEASKAG